MHKLEFSRSNFSELMTYKTFLLKSCNDLVYFFSLDLTPNRNYKN